MIEKLQWDADFYGFGVGCAKLSDVSNLKLSYLKDIPDISHYRLVYLFHDKSNEDLKPKLSIAEIKFINKTGAKFVDTKLIFKYEFKEEDTFNLSEDIIEYQEKSLAQDLVTLAFQSGKYSRFNMDNNFPAGSFERMYLLWIKKSVEGELADKVFVYKVGKRIMGMVTVSKKQDFASIGLLSVDEKMRGRGIGRLLMNRVMDYVQKEDLKVLLVPTQLENTEACGFYKKCGFKIESIQHIYHLWL